MEANTRAILDKFKDYLESRYVRRDSQVQTFSHVSKAGGIWKNGRYWIDDDDFFMQNYSKLINKEIYPTIGERPRKLRGEFNAFGPLRVDLDFKADEKMGCKRQYTDTMIQQLVLLYQEEILNIVADDVSVDKTEIVKCIVLEKKAPRKENGVIKDGFHLHFPYFICKARIQDEYLRDRVTKKMIEKGIWNGTNYTTKLSEMIDEKMAGKPWLMYGSRNYKNENSEPYLYRGKAFGYDAKPIGLKKLFENDEHNCVRFGAKKIKQNLPELLSIRRFKEDRLVPLNTFMKKREEKQTRKNRQRIRKTRTEAEISTDIKIIQDGDIMSMISPARADTYYQWMYIGWTLFNVGQGDERCLDMWDEFSQHSDKYVVGDCADRWNKMTIGTTTIATLLWLAKNDSPEKYEQWRLSRSDILFEEALTRGHPTHVSVARIIKSLYGDQYKCVNKTKGIWYQYKNHRWNLLKENISLENHISDDLPKLFRKHSKNCWNGEDKESDKVKIKRTLNMIDKLEDVTFIRKSIEAVGSKIYDDEFENVRDQNDYLFGCENGVLDLNTCVFRPGEPEDNITMSCKLHYNEYYEDDEEVKELDEFLLKIFPNERIRDYFICFMSSCLEGGNKHKRLVFGTGDGDNGKTVTFNFMSLVFGDYYGKLPRNELILGGAKGTTAPFIIANKCKRVIQSDEIAENENLALGKIKELSGNEHMVARDLYAKASDVQKVRACFKLIIQCNKPPKIPSSDKTTWNRIRVIDFESTFIRPGELDVKPVPKKLEDQIKAKTFVADLSIEDKMKRLAPVMLWKLFNVYRNVYKKHGLFEPQEVRMSTLTYKTDNDVYLQFKNAILKESPDADPVKSQPMYRAFKEWYDENHPNTCLKDKIGRAEFKKKMRELLGDVNEEKKTGWNTRKYQWEGYKIDDPDRDGDDENPLGGVLGR